MCKWAHRSKSYNCGPEAGRDAKIFVYSCRHSQVSILAFSMSENKEFQPII